jgi:uncharacterized protein (TIGR02231 family)
MAVREMTVESYGEVIDFVTESLREVAAKKRGRTKARRELQPELDAARRKLNEMMKLTKLQESTVFIALESEKAVNVELMLTYVMAGATWEVSHEFRAVGLTPESVELTSFAVVTQTTGEKWEGATISFSTQSPSQTMRIPEIDALIVGNTRAVARFIGGKSRSFAAAQRLYASQNQEWYYQLNPRDDMAVFGSNVAGQALTAERISRVFTQLQERGTTAHFLGKGKPTVRCDGAPVRVPIGEVKLGARSRIVAAPQASLNAVRTVEMVNESDQALLPGQISLYHDGAFLGMTENDFVASGEAFTVFLGVADYIKLSRVLNRKQSSIKRGRNTRMAMAWEVCVENLCEYEVTVNLADRIPVSQNKEIRVYGVKISPDGEPDQKGMLNWELVLKPKEERVFIIQYTIEYPSDTIEKMKRGSSAPSVMPDDDVYYRIESLEKLF